MGVWTMNARELTDKADQWAENAFLKLIGRVGMASAFPVLIASMSWLGSTLWSMNAEQGKLAGRIAVLTTTIELQMSGRYRDTDAARDFRARDQKDAEQDRRLDRLDVQVDRMAGNRQGGPR